MGDFGIIDGEGWVTLPRSVRDRLGLKAGDRIEFVVEGERIVIRPARSDEEINASIADMRDDNDDK
jgi:AbrB family looped-hinge helix DNA binding protein